MTDTSFLEWPFLSKLHKDLYFKLEDWAENNLKDLDHNNVDNTCKLLVSKLGSAGFLNYSGISEETLFLNSAALFSKKELTPSFASSEAPRESMALLSTI